MVEDIQLLRHYAETRAEKTFAALVARHVPFVYSAALRQLNGAVHRAEDVTQTVFIELARQAAPLSRRDEIVGWLYTCTHHAAAKLKRSEARRQQREQEAHTMHELPSESLSGADWERLRPVLDDAMHELSESSRQAILLRFFKNEHFGVVGRRLGLTEDAARMRVERALEKLRMLLAERGVTSTAGALGIALASQTVAAAPSGLAGTVASAAAAQAAASVAGEVGASFVNFMSTAKITGVAAVGVMAIGAGLFYTVRASHAEAALVNVNRDTSAMHHRLRDVNGRIAAAASSRAETGRSVSATVDATATPTVTTADRSAIVAAAAREAVMRELLANPQFTDLKLQTALAAIGHGRQLFYQRLGLAPEQISRFESILAEAMREAWRVRVAAQLADRVANDPTTEASLQPARARMEDGIRTLLGEAGLAAFLEHERSKPADDFALLLALNLYFTDSRVTPEQGRRLAALLIRLSPDFQQGKDVVLLNIDFAHVLTEAAAWLAPLQLETVQGLRHFYEFQRELAAARRADSESWR